MKSEFTAQALKDLEALSEEQLKAIRSKVEDLEDNPTGDEKVKLIRISGVPVYRAKVKESRGGEVDNRIIYDVRDGKIMIYSVIHRDEGYDEEKLEDRLNR